MGLITLQLARRGGAARTLVSEPNPLRRQLALQLGADRAIDPGELPLPQAVREFTRGAGVDAAFETAGSTIALTDCLNVVKNNGLVVIVGVHPESARLALELYKYHPRNLTLKWSWGAAGYGGFAEAAAVAVRWLGQIQFTSLISHRFGLGDMKTAFEIARDRKGFKVLVYPGDVDRSRHSGAG